MGSESYANTLQFILNDTATIQFIYYVFREQNDILLTYNGKVLNVQALFPYTYSECNVSIIVVMFPFVGVNNPSYLICTMCIRDFSYQ